MADALLVDSTATGFDQQRHTRRNDLEPIPPKYHKVLAMHLAGNSVKQICAETNYKIPSVYKILNDPRVQAIRQQLLKTYQDEFEALQGLVNERLRDALHHGDIEVNLKATQQWLATQSKKKEGSGNQQFNITAEDVVVQILNQGQGQ